MFLISLVLGVVEGLTEFLPISSTGHLILTISLLGVEEFAGRRADVFVVFIQLGAILSVVWEYRSRLTQVVADLPGSATARGFVRNIAIAFVPSVVLGLLVHDYIIENLFYPATVAAALITGGILILVVERLPLRHDTVDSMAIGWKQALGIGLAQCVALLWPGFSRSAATILGGLSARLDRRTATEFSFFLAIPTMFGATTYSLYKTWRWLEPGDFVWLFLSSFVSFVVALGSIRWLLRFVSNHTFRPFAWYRIGLGLIIIWVLSLK